MNTEKIAAKLKPLNPEKIAHWLKTRELVDPELRTLIDKQIISAVQSQSVKRRHYTSLTP